MSHIALSYSRLSTYEQCPFKFDSQYLKKDYPDDSDNFHFIKGNKKHKQLDHYVKCKKDPTMMHEMYDGDVKDATVFVDRLISNGFDVKSELQLSVNKSWTPVTWFSKLSMYRAICDIIAVKGSDAVVLDWKTGKFRDYDGKPTGQLHLSSAVVFAHLPEIDTIYTSYKYIEHKQSVNRKFTRDMYDSTLRTPFIQMFDTVNEDSEFAPKKNQFCNWCLIKDRCPLW